MSVRSVSPLKRWPRRLLEVARDAEGVFCLCHALFPFLTGAVHAPAHSCVSGPRPSTARPGRGARRPDATRSREHRGPASAVCPAWISLGK